MITVYTKNYCPYCTSAKNLLNELEVTFEEINITETPEQIEALVKKSGLRTVPQIFVGEKCLGGYDDIAKLHKEGKLLSLLKGE